MARSPRRKRVSPRQRIYLGSVPVQARTALAWLDSLPQEQPDFEERLKATLDRCYRRLGRDGFDESGGGWNFVLLHQPGGNFTGKVFVVTPLLLSIVDAQSLKADLTVSWPWVFQFESRADGDYRIFGFGFYCGPLAPTDRIKSGNVLREGEVENHYFYVHNGDPLIDFAIEQIGLNEVLSPIDDGTFPLF